MLNCYIINDISGLTEISSDWDRLVQNSEFNDIFATSGFARTWWRTYNEGKTLSVIVVRNEDLSVRLIAPFYYDNIFPKTLRLIGDFGADYNNLVYEKGDLVSQSFFFSWLFKQNFWWKIRLTKIPGESSILNFFPNTYNPSSRCLTNLAALLDLRYPLVYLKILERHPVMSRDLIIQSSKRLENKHHRRKIKDFSKQGHLEYRSISDSNQIREWLPSFMDLHIEQWRTKEDPSIFNKEINRKYIYSLLDEMDLQNSLRMDLLLLDKELVAADFNFTWDNRIYGYLTCYSLKYFQYSPGTLLLGYMIRDASINNFNEIDFLLGRENYKEPLASYIRKTGIMIIFHSRLDWFYDFWGTSMMKIRRLLIQIRTKLSRNNTQSAKPVDNVI